MLMIYLFVRLDIIIIIIQLYPIDDDDNTSIMLSILTNQTNIDECFLFVFGHKFAHNIDRVMS